MFGSPVPSPARLPDATLFSCVRAVLLLCKWLGLTLSLLFLVRPGLALTLPFLLRPDLLLTLPLLLLPSRRRWELLRPDRLALGMGRLRLPCGPRSRLIRLSLLFPSLGLLLLLGVLGLSVAPVLVSECWHCCSEKQQEQACLNLAYWFHNAASLSVMSCVLRPVRLTRSERSSSVLLAS